MSEQHQAPNPTTDQAAYWNEEGGRRWVANIERVERMLQPLSDELLALAAPAPGELALDVGCGGGLTSAALARAVEPAGAVLGLDGPRQGARGLHGPRAPCSGSTCRR